MKIKFVQPCELLIHEDVFPRPTNPIVKYCSIGDELEVENIRTYLDLGQSRIRFLDGRVCCIPTILFEVIS